MKNLTELMSSGNWKTGVEWESSELIANLSRFLIKTLSFTYLIVISWETDMNT